MTTPSNGRSVVGFIGLGDQGLPMAEAIAGAGFPVHAWARRPEVWDDPRLSALTRQDSPEALAAAADILAVCVNTDATVLPGGVTASGDAAWNGLRQSRHRDPGQRGRVGRTHRR
ncbi:NAD(P)-binding domain-containing protein [Streptomyces sp. 900116325]